MTPDEYRKKYKSCYTCKECIHYEICQYYKEPVSIIEDCDYYRNKKNYVEVPIDKNDLSKIYEDIANAMINIAKRLKGEDYDRQ